MHLFFLQRIRLIETCGTTDVLKVKNMQKSLQDGEIKIWTVRLRKEEKSEGHVILSLTGVFS